MHAQLADDRLKRNEILSRALAMAEKYYDQQEILPPGRFVDDIPMDDLPEEGKGALETLSFFDAHYSRLISNSAGSRYFGFVTGGSTPAAVAADWLVPVYDQNACGSNDSIAPLLERQAIGYFKQLFGLSDDFYGSFVTGATMANFVGLALARQWLGEQRGIDVAEDGLAELSIVVASGTPHSSALKSMAMLGIGRRSLNKIDTIEGREAVDVGKLETFLAARREPVIVIANAGTVNTGDFDNLSAIAALKQKYSFWLHIDAAFGGFAACSQKFMHLMAGVNGADSLTVDAHKWLNVPYDAAMQFTRHPSLQLKIFQNSAAYLSDPATAADFFHYTPESSRRWRALPSWFSLRAYGRNGYREIVERNCEMARQLGEYVSTTSEFVLLSPVRLNIVCFTLNHPNADFACIQKFLEAVREDGNVFFTPTVYKGTPAIRAAISNWQTGARDIELTCQVITRVFQHFEYPVSESSDVDI